MVQFRDRVWGPDVSSWQGDVDWSAVKKDGASFGITKITEGVDYVNPFAKGEWGEMGRLGLERVQYHYARPVRNSASDEALWFLANMLPLSPGDIIALDLETDSRDGEFSNGAHWANGWFTAVRASMHFEPMLYCNSGIIRDPKQRFQDFPEMGQRNGLWLAAWNEVLPNAPAPWEIVALWQFTNAGQVPGIAGSVDLNIFNGTLETMRKYGAPASGGIDPPSNPDLSDLYSRLSGIGNKAHDLAEELGKIVNEAWDLARRFGP